MQSLKVEFIKSAVKADQFPRLELPEVAFAGRSNVGKSSLINTLIGQRGVARVSQTPGRTQAVNFFKVGTGWVFADLPGYGYAKVPLDIKAEWQGLIQDYLTLREALQGVVLIVDVRREPMDSDRQLRDFFVERQLPLLVVATKCDKLSKQQVDRSIAAIARGLEVPSELIVPFSSETRLGRDLLLKEVESLMKDGAAAMKEARRQAAADAADRQEAEPVVIVGEDLLARPAGSGGSSRRGGR